MKYFSLLLACLLVLNVNAQKTGFKWGKPNADDWSIKVCPYDSAAPVIMLDESGAIEFGYGTGYVNIKKHFKLKILDEKGLESAVIHIPVYAKDNFEKLVDIDAHTLNLDEKGKLIETNVESKQFFDVDTRDNWKETRFTFPSVKKGSILEYRYTIQSKNYTFLDGWMFQSSYPTLHSSFSAKITEGLDYKIMYQGKRLVEKYGATEHSSEWELYYLPALKEEPYMSNYLDYAEKIKFQLVGYIKSEDTGGTEQVSLLTNWESISDEVGKSTEYIDYQNNNRLNKEILSAIPASATTPLAKAEAIYNRILKTIRWNGHYSVFPEFPASKLPDHHEGSSADLNLWLWSVLRQADFDVVPMLVSTREHGAIFNECAVVSQFNSVIVYLRIDGKEYFLDATDIHRPMYLPPSELLGTSGYCVDRKKPFWAEINCSRKSKSSSLINLFVGNTDTTRFTMDFSFDDYSALKYRNLVEHSGKKEAVLSLLGKANSSVNIDKIESENMDSCSLPFKIRVEGYATHLVNISGKLIYFSPLMIPRTFENPFTEAERVYPVDFSFPENNMSSMIIHIQDGMSVENLPLPANLTIPKEMLSFMYSASSLNQLISISSRFNINNLHVPANYYPNLRSLYTKMIGKLNEPIVFRLK